MLLSNQYIGTTITHLRGESIIDSFVSVSSVLRSTDKSNNPSSLCCTIVDLNRVFTRFSPEKLRLVVQELIGMAEIMPYTLHNSGNATF